MPVAPPQACRRKLTHDKLDLEASPHYPDIFFGQPHVKVWTSMSQVLSRMHTCDTHTDGKIRCQNLARDQDHHLFYLTLPPYCLAKNSPPLMLRHLYYQATCAWSSFLLPHYRDVHACLIGGGDVDLLWGWVMSRKAKMGRRERGGRQKQL